MKKLLELIIVLLQYFTDKETLKKHEQKKEKMEYKYPYSKTSRAKLNTCHEDLIVLFEEISKYQNTTILCGERTKNEQDKAVEEGRSGVSYPNSKHNSEPSMAVDAAPWPVVWDDLHRWTYWAGKVMLLADKLYDEGKITHRIRWGRNWDMNDSLTDEIKRGALLDWPHFEVVIEDE